jgi:hypothetical protein
MSYRGISIVSVCASLVLLSLVACMGGERTPKPTVFKLTFDGQKCTLDGPTEMKSGPISLTFINASNGDTSWRFFKHPEDHPIQDMIDYLEPPGSKNVGPWWASDMSSGQEFSKGESAIVWEGNLGTGIYSVVCDFEYSGSHHFYFGTGLTVK